MNTSRGFSLQQQKSRCWAAMFPLVLLISVTGCSEEEVPLDPIGQFDDGTYEIRDAKDTLVGEIFARHINGDYNNSFEYWVVGMEFCATNAMNSLTNCKLDQRKIHAVPGSSYESSDAGTDAAFNAWKLKVSEDLKSLNNPIVFRAKYTKHENPAWDCSKNPSCTYSPGGMSTSISMYSKPGLFGKDGAVALPFVSVGTDMNGKMFETWFMGRFFNVTDDARDFTMPNIGDTATFPCAVCTRAPSIVVDVNYEKCKALPSTITECQ